MERLIICQDWAIGILFFLFTMQAGYAAERNVILIIGDGMDDHQITIARNYLVGPRSKLTLDTMPMRGVVQVLTVSENDPDKPVYVADSANSASAMATGIVTSRGRIATSAHLDEDATTIVELAHSAGYRTGIVTSASVTDATPAAFVAHINIRGCENPDTMQNFAVMGDLVIDCSQDLKANGGLGSIAEQIAESSVDVILGGGEMHFLVNREAGSGSLFKLAEQSGFEVLGNSSDLDKLDFSPNGKRLLGVFAEKELPVRLRGENDRSAEAPDPSLLNGVYWALGSVEFPEPMLCENNPAFEGVPSLKKMTDVALQKLSTNNIHGFFLMVESASIDKQSHARKACGSIGEVQQLNEVLDSALNFAAEHPDTLIIVTADHSQAAQLVPDESLFTAIGVPVFTPGLIVRIQTPQKSILAVNYATNSFPAEEHTGANVPLFSNAVGKSLIKSYVTQPELFFIIRDYLGLGPGSVPSSDGSPIPAPLQSEPMPTAATR